MSHDAASGDAPASGSGRRLVDRVKDEFRKLFLIVVYLWLLFGLLQLHEMLIRRELGFAYQAEGLALINALVLGKVMLIAEDFNLGGGRRGKPLVYPILRQAFLFSVLFLVVHILEGVVTELVSGSTERNNVSATGGGRPWDVLTVAAILFIALVPYFAFRDISRELGSPTMHRLLFKGSTGVDTDLARANAAPERPHRE